MRGCHLTNQDLHSGQSCDAARVITEHTVRKVWSKETTWLSRDDGQDLPEYALLIGLIALLLFTVLTVLGDSLFLAFSEIASVVGT